MDRFSNMFSTEIVEAVKEHGYAIIENVLDKSELAELTAQISGNLNKTSADSANPFMGDKIKRFGRLLHTVPASRRVALNKTTNGVIREILCELSPTYQLHFTGVMHVEEGAEAQVLHRDVTPFPNPGPMVVVATMWAISDFTKDNGATVFVPGSHLWHDSRAPKTDEVKQAVMPAGSVLIYAGNLIHGSGRSFAGFRTGLSLQYCVSWLRQEENQYLAVPQEEVKAFDPELQRLMGYDLAARHWGYVGQTHPLNYLNGIDAVGGLDQVGYEFEGRVKKIIAEVPGELHLKQWFKIN